MKRVALFSVLSKKAKDGEVKVFDSLMIEAPKTKNVATALRAVLSPKKGDKRFDVLLVSDNANKNLFRATSNLQKTKTIEAGSLNVYDLMNHKNLFIDKSVVETIEKHYKI
jgi:large subunit ribosomal protein L4